MPGTTPLGITYPCSGETIDPVVFQVYASGVQIALTAQQDLADLALYPDAAQGIRTTDQNINAGVSTNIQFTDEAYDSDSSSLLFVPPSTIFNIQHSGVYLINVQANNLTPPATWTSVRVAIAITGVEVSAAKSDAGSVIDQSNTRVNTSYLAIISGAVAVTFPFLYTGGASPMGVIGYASIIRVAL